MTGYYDNNFGHWDNMDDPEMEEFYDQVQAESVWKNCVICGRAVKLRPHYDKCDSCCTKLERGMDPEWCDPEDYEPLPGSNEQ